MAATLDLDCAICLEVREDPVRLRPCGHGFCRTCLESAASSMTATPKCPLCRQMSTAVDADTETAQALVSRKLRCPSCNEEVQASALRKHKAGCAAEMKAAQESVEQARARVKPDASRNPNRSTFKCPFPDCPADHMDGKDLCAHFDTVHPGASCAAICPVCVTMPWGDPNYISRDVVGHIRLRHKFTYDEYVDYQEAGDEDAILQAVLRQSLEQR